MYAIHKLFSAIFLVAVLSISITANAALVGRDLDGNTATVEAYYDAVLNITWLADANLATSNTFGVNSIYSEGAMSWDTATSWISAMNTSSYLGLNEWRLSRIIDTGASGCDWAYSVTDCGYNLDTATGEMAHLFYETLGNTAYYDTSGTETGCPTWPLSCLSNTGPFNNIQSREYWSGTTYAPYSLGAWIFNFGNGAQFDTQKEYSLFAWAVHDGDVGASVVPVPAAVWLFGSGLLGLIGVAKRSNQ